MIHFFSAETFSVYVPPPTLNGLTRVVERTHDDAMRRERRKKNCQRPSENTVTHAYMRINKPLLSNMLKKKTPHPAPLLYFINEKKKKKTFYGFLLIMAAALL